MINGFIVIIVLLFIIITILTGLYAKEIRNNRNEISRIIFDTDKLFIIFKNNTMFSLNYGATISDVKTYNRVLTEEEIDKLFTEKKTDITIK